jgi:hypothetical protein
MNILPLQMQKTPSQFRFYAGLFLLAILTFCLSLIRLGWESIWVDEATVIYMQDWGELWQTMRVVEANMALYQILMHFWVQIGGIGELWVRGFSVIWAVGGVLMLAELGRLLFNARVGLLAGLLLALNAFFIYYAQEARAYSLHTFLAILSTYCGVIAITQKRRAWYLAYAFSAALLVYSHLFGLFIIAAQGASVIFLPRAYWQGKTWFLTGFTLSVLLGAVVFYPFGSGQLDWIPPVSAETFFRFINSLSTYGILMVLFISLLILGNLKLKSAMDRWYVALLLLWLCLPIGLTLAFSIGYKPIFVDRYLLSTLPAFILLLAWALEQLPRPLFILFLAIWILAGGIRLIDVYEQRNKHDWREVFVFLSEQASPGDQLAMFPFFEQQNYRYYQARLPDLDLPQNTNDSIFYYDDARSKFVLQKLLPLPSETPNPDIWFVRNVGLNSPEMGSLQHVLFTKGYVLVAEYYKHGLMIYHYQWQGEESP